MSSTVKIPTSELVETTYAPRPAGRVRRRRLIIGATLFVVGLGMAGGAYWLGLPGVVWGQAADEDTVFTVRPVSLNITLKEDGELKPVNSHEIKCEVQSQGLTIEWVIDESTRVKKGDLLMKLASADLKERVEMEQIEVDRLKAAVVGARQDLQITCSENDSRLDKARVNLAVAHLDLQKYTEGDYKNSLKSIDIAIAKTNMDIDQRKDELAKSRPLHERGFVTKSKIDELESTIEQLQMTLEKQELEKATLLAYDYPKSKMQKDSEVKQATDELEREIQRAESRKRQAEEKLATEEKTLAVRLDRFERLKEQYTKSEIHAPIDGVVQYGDSGGGRYGWGGNRVAPGEQVYPGQTLLTIPDTSQMMVSTRIHEADRHMIREGLACMVRVPAVPGQVLPGKLTKIAQFADSENAWWNPELKEHTAEIRLADTKAEISPGDTAEVEILIEEVQNVLAVPVQCVYSRGPKRFVFVKRLTSAEPVEVVLGRSSTAMIEATKGLEVGDQVLMHVDERLLAKLPAASTLPTEQSPREEAGDGQPQTAKAAEPPVTAPAETAVAAPAETAVAAEATPPTATEEAPAAAPVPAKAEAGATVEVTTEAQSQS